MPVQAKVVATTGDDVHIAEYAAALDVSWRLLSASMTFLLSRGMAEANGRRANAKKAVGTKRPWRRSMIDVN